MGWGPGLVCIPLADGAALALIHFRHSVICLCEIPIAFRIIGKKIRAPCEPGYEDHRRD
jgi:hypothetical protein